MHATAISRNSVYLQEQLTSALSFANQLLSGEDSEFRLDSALGRANWWKIIKELKNEGFIVIPNAIRHPNGFLEFATNFDGSLSLKIVKLSPRPTLELVNSARMAEPLMWDKINRDNQWLSRHMPRKPKSKRFNFRAWPPLWDHPSWKYWTAPEPLSTFTRQGSQP